MGIQQIPLAASGATLAEITTAIQTNAAPASVTNTSIATQVANNATPFGGTWTDLGTFTTGGTTTTTFSSLSGYKYLRLYVNVQQNAAEYIRLRFNGDTGNNYYFFYATQAQQSYHAPAVESSFYTTSVSSQKGIHYEIRGSNSSAKKHVTMYNGAEGASLSTGVGVWNSTAAISSITVFSLGNFNSVYMNLQGAN